MKLTDISCPVCGSEDTIAKERQETDIHGLSYTYRAFYCRNCRSNTISNLYNLENDPSEDVFGRIWYSCSNCGYYYNSDEVDDYKEYKKLTYHGFYSLVNLHGCPMCGELVEETIRTLREEEYDDYREYYDQ